MGKNIIELDIFHLQVAIKKFEEFDDNFNTHSDLVSLENPTTLHDIMDIIQDLESLKMIQRN